MTRNRGRARGGGREPQGAPLVQSALAFIPKILDRPVQPFRVHRLSRLFPGLDRLRFLLGTTLIRVPLRFRFVSLIQVYALHRNGGDSRRRSEIKLVPPNVD
jgi:hypothetical protein